MYNAWLDLFIKLPCFGLFREDSLREGAGTGAGRGFLQRRVQLTLFGSSAAQAVCPSGVAPACQGSEVGGQPSREPEPLVLSAASDTERPFLEAWGKTQVSSRQMRSCPGRGLVSLPQVLARTWDRTGSSTRRPPPSPRSPVALVPMAGCGWQALKKQKEPTLGLCSVSPPETHPLGAPCPASSPGLHQPLGSFPGVFV